jgi:hypothetical protein
MKIDENIVKRLKKVERLRKESLISRYKTLYFEISLLRNFSEGVET